MLIWKPKCQFCLIFFAGVPRPHTPMTPKEARRAAKKAAIALRGGISSRPIGEDSDDDGDVTPSGKWNILILR